MSIRIRVSYMDDEELYEVVRRLMPVADIKLQPQQGQFKRAYIDLKGADLETLLTRPRYL